MDYRYQEWRDGLHNFNDRVILTLELCLYMRHGLQSHVSVSRMISCLESFRGQKFPAVNIIFRAYCHFEALNNTEYSYSCVICGFFPAVVTMDLHRSRGAKLEVSELKTPPEDFDGQHNIEDFWDSVHLEMISQGFFPSSSTNPFVVHPCYEHWAPWIGKETRKSDSVLNTEFKKIPTSETEGELSSVTADRLCDELLKQNEATLQHLCKSCGVEASGSRADLIFRLREKLKNQQTYVNVYQSIWGASGGWSVVACPHGIVYSLKFNLLTESPRDFADLLLSWKHFPNVCLYDSAHGLATHTNSRVADNPPFHPHEGKPAAPTKENLAKAVCRKLKVPLPWLREKLENSEENGHPITGTSHHYALHDKLHQSNTKDPHDALRRVDLVPELQDYVKSKAVKHLFADMRKNSYFLNSMAPSTHMFLMRNLIEYRNAFCNTQLMEIQLK
ncbi:HMG domain-containing protein 3 isoform X2 [Siniperca chuatsi]|nr:HMG domain-containing protein 3 isoform X2 [Siniperca chuatsi]